MGSNVPAPLDSQNSPAGGGDGSWGGLNSDSPLGAIVNIIGAVIGDLNGAIQATEQIPLAALYNGISRQVTKFVALATGDHTQLWDQVTSVTVGTFYKDLLELGLGVDTDQFDALAKQGMQTTDTMLGFAYIMPWIVAAAGLAGKIPLAGRWIEAALEPLGHLPEEMGLSWALGIQIEEAFSAATGESVLEGIRRQKRSSRLDWPILRTALRQRVIPHDRWIDVMKNLGYPDEQIDMIQNLDKTAMPIGELSQLWRMDVIGREDFRTALRELGYTEQDVNRLTTLYIDQAQFASGVLLRTTARSLAANQLISLGQYEQILGQVRTPQREIKDDIAAVHLEIEHGHLQTSITNIKNLYLRGHMTAAQAQQELRQLGYSDQAVLDTMASWEAGPAPRPLSMARVLSYFLSGALTEDETRQRLAAAGIRPHDVDLILAHAHDVPRVRQHPLTTALVTQAYLDGALTHEQLAAAYERAGASGEVAQDLIASAVFRKSRQKRPAGQTVPLSASQIVDAWGFGLVDTHHALDELEGTGYSADDAMLLLSIKNKGPVSLAPPPRPDFASLQDAISYLQARGYHVNAPPDPLIQEAEGIVWSHGYSITPPANQQGGGSGAGGGGGGGQSQ